MAYQYVTGDTGSKIDVIVRDQTMGTVVDLTGCSVTLRWLDAANVLVDRLMTITSPLTGACEYKFATGELFAPKMVFEVEYTDTLGNIVTLLDTIEASVREQIG